MFRLYHWVYPGAGLLLGINAAYRCFCIYAVDVFDESEYIGCITLKQCSVMLFSPMERFKSFKQLFTIKDVSISAVGKC